MKYYKAIPQPELPYINFNEVAESLEHLQELGLENDPLIVTEDQLFDDNDADYISYEFGICSKKISSGGALINRSSSEITARQAVVSRIEKINKTEELEQEFKKQVLSHEGQEYPLTPAARETYNAVFNAPVNDDITVQTVDGVYTITSAERDAFKTAYYSKILELKDTKLEA